MPSAARFGRGVLSGAALLGAAACGDGPSEPVSRPPYLAMVSTFDQPPEPDVAAQFGYRVQDIGGATALDTLVHAVPTDTVILALPTSTYRVTLTGLPERCSPHSGPQREVPIIPEINTGIARYAITCVPSLKLTVFSLGSQADDAFIYHLAPESGTEQSGVISGNDSLFVNALPAGRYTLSLGHVSGHCVVVSDGGTLQRFELPTTGGASRSFTVICSDLTQRPVIAALRASQHDGAVGFVIRTTDPDRDIRRFFWDITGCDHASVKPGGAVERQHFDPQRTDADTVVLLGAAELEMSEAELADRCLAVRVADFRGNTTPWTEYRMRETGTRPAATQFNAVLIGQQAIRIELAAEDPDGDFVGTVVAGRIREGVLRPPDGHDDFLYRNPEGYLSAVVPDFPVGSPFPGPLDVTAILVYLIDRDGNFGRYIDEDTFR